MFLFQHGCRQQRLRQGTPFERLKGAVAPDFDQAASIAIATKLSVNLSRLKY
jgi:hypothetical protein